MGGRKNAIIGRPLMYTRKKFIERGMMALTAISIPGYNPPIDAAEYPPFKTKDTKRAMVIWFSQTGHTARLGRLIAWQLEKSGLTVISGDHRDIDSAKLSEQDLIIAGAPVYYYDVPVTFRDWLQKIPRLNGIPVAAYSTYGGPGHNQHNTACALAELLADKGGVPVGINSFGNMSTFAPTWSTGRIERIVKYKHLPDRDTYDRAKSFSSAVLEKVKSGASWEIDYDCTLFSMMKPLGTAWWTKNLLLDKHYIDQTKCVQCGLCEDRCPSKAISIAEFKIDSKKCIFCVGCVNICPEEAHTMIFMGKPVYGFETFLKRQNIIISEPAELI